jgi:large subunit ribosomal protein L4
MAELAARRQGTHATKTRGMVSGGSVKPWRQKGTGRARAGSTRSPIWTGGGTVFGPQPRHYTFKVNRKARRAALRSALSMHADRGSIAVTAASEWSEPSTKRAAEAINGWETFRPVLVLVAEDEVGLALSFRNLPEANVLPVDSVGVADVIRAGSLILSDAALERVTERAVKPVRSGASTEGGEE